MLSFFDCIYIKINYNSTYSLSKTNAYYTVYFYDWEVDKIYEYTLNTTIPRGTKKNWSDTFEIKVPRGAVYYHFY